MWYRTGTITVLENSPVVTGSDTLWFEEVSPGDIFIGPDDLLYEVRLVTNDTQISIRSFDGQDKYLGASDTDASYVIIRNFTSTTTASLTERLSALLTKWHAHEDERDSWMAGTVDGGPNSDGFYPMTDPLGNITLVPCLNYLEQLTSGSLDTAITDAEAARDKAALWAEADEDTEVEPDQYSALHHALKAAASQNDVESIKTDIDAFFDGTPASPNTYLRMRPDGNGYEWVYLETPYSKTTTLLPIVNHDAETGDMTGWSSTGTLSKIRTDTSRSGSCSFMGNGGISDMYQDIDLLAQGISAELLDTGKMEVFFGLWQSSYAGADMAQLALQCLDAGLLELSNESNAMVAMGTGVWTNREIRGIAPTGTRYLRVIVNHDREGGTYSDGYVDDLYAKAVHTTTDIDDGTFGSYTD